TSNKPNTRGNNNNKTTSSQQQEVQYVSSQQKDIIEPQNSLTLELIDSHCHFDLILSRLDITPNDIEFDRFCKENISDDAMNALVTATGKRLLLLLLFIINS